MLITWWKSAQFLANPLLTTKCLDLCIQMMLGPDDCPVVSASGQVRGARCGKQLSGVCVAKHCAGRGRGRGRGCCKMTREEAWQWERRVQGRSIVLRPHTPHVKVCFKNIFCKCPHIFVPRLHRLCRPLVRRARCAARWCGWWRAWSGARPCSAWSGCGCWPGTTPSGGTKPTTPAGRSTSNHILTRGSGYNF